MTATTYEDLRYGRRYVISYTGTAVHRPDVGGLAVMKVDGHGNLVRRIDGFETITPLLDVVHADGPWNLTTRERQVAALLLEGMTNPQIAHELGLSAHTVNQHVRHIARKLDARNRIQIAVKLIRHGLLEANRG